MDFLAPEVLGTPGRLGLTGAPGAGGGAWFGMDPDTALRRDLEGIRHRYGTQTLVTLMPLDELDRFGLASLPELVRRSGMTWLHLGIVDMSVPLDAHAFDSVVDELARRLCDGETVVVHCLGGFGRSGTLASAVLARLGRDAEAAIAAVRAARQGAVQTAEQEAFVAAYAERSARLPPPCPPPA